MDRQGLNRGIPATDILTLPNGFPLGHDSNIFSHDGFCGIILQRAAKLDSFQRRPCKCYSAQTGVATRKAVTMNGQAPRSLPLRTTRFTTTSLLLMITCFVLLFLIVAKISISSMNGYDMNILSINLGSYYKLNKNDWKAIRLSLIFGIFMSMLCSAYALMIVAYAFFYKKYITFILVLIVSVSGCQALRAVSTSLYLGVPSDYGAAFSFSMKLLLATLVAFSNLFPFASAVFILGIGDRISRYFEVYRNLGGEFGSALRLVVFPVARASIVASVLVTLPLAVFDPYSLRVAGDQVFPSIGGLLIDLQSASEWPLISVVCLITLLFVAPVFIVLLPFTGNSARDE